MTLDQEVQLASLAMQAIAKIVEAFVDAKSGAIDPTAALAGIQVLHDAIDANNAAVDAALAARFP